ncbi:MAG: FmdB family zinc ribbon protein [Candidatus Binatus sp.]|uniref:FmdB family zinc ribbon protein n=1 Tax=Candidatus Binatus sp. TaxID=2811406 RepID=UPI003BAF8F14
MPIFEYSCGRCGALRSILMLKGDREPKRCEACGSPRLIRLMSGFSIRSDSIGSNDDEALRYRPTEFLEEPAKFEKAMKSLQKRTGAKLRGEQVDDAMHRLSEAKRQK